MKSVSPNLYVQDINATVELYKQLGFTVTATVPDETPSRSSQKGATILFGTSESKAEVPLCCIFKQLALEFFLSKLKIK